MISFPLSRMPNALANKKELFKGIQKMSMWNVFVTYVTNSHYRQSKPVRDWYVTGTAINSYEAPKFIGTQRQICQQALDHVRSQIKYKSDDGEEWLLPIETWVRKEGDCEDGAILLLEILRQNGIPPEQLYLVAGDVKGGGHAYVIWYSDEDVQPYVLDWCYWPLDSLLVPYEDNPNYFFGTKEWFRFNWEGSYVKR